MDRTNDQAGVPIFLTSDRLASLSDTMFGVAMTLVATTLLPSFRAHHGSVLTMLRDVNGQLAAVVLSFVISARYWVLQQQRLAMTRLVTPRQTWFNLLFLFLIVLVPISTSLDGLTGADATKGAVLLYGSHLTLLAVVNLWLWIEAPRIAAVHGHLVRSSVALTICLVALAVGFAHPDFAVYVWLTIPAASSLSHPIARRFYKP